MENKLNAYQNLASPLDFLREKVHVVLVRPEEPQNVGSICRAMGNMGVLGKLVAVNPLLPLNSENAQRLAKHSKSKLLEAQTVDSLEEAFSSFEGSTLKIAASARAGSSSRPHPLLVEEAMKRALNKLKAREYHNLVLVFGPEGDGLKNEEVDSCDWIAMIPSHHEYRSLNLAQACLIFFYELERFVLAQGKVKNTLRHSKPGQKEKLISHLLEMAEVSGFVLPGDPYKMRARLEAILASLPLHIAEATLLHGWIDQVVRSLKKGEVDFKGRYRHVVEERKNDNAGRN